MHTQLNIGMGNNPLRINQTFKIVSEILTQFSAKDIKHRFDVGQYLDEIEETLIISFYGDNQELTEKIVTSLCILFDQECIAIKINDKGLLIFNPTYTGEIYSFNEDYFINF